MSQLLIIIIAVIIVFLVRNKSEVKCIRLCMDLSEIDKTYIVSACTGGWLNPSVIDPETVSSLIDRDWLFIPPTGNPMPTNKADFIVQRMTEEQIKHYYSAEITLHAKPNNLKVS